MGAVVAVAVAAVVAVGRLAVVVRPAGVSMTSPKSRLALSSRSAR